MKKDQVTVLITGASGFIGSYLVNRIKESYNIISISRRRPVHYDTRNHPNIMWVQTDIGDMKSVNNAIQTIRSKMPVDFIIHLAGFYDFKYDNNPQYERTNVTGTQNILEAAKSLKIKRFIFASSVAACEFPRKNNERIYEGTPADAGFAYAVSKRKGEELVSQYSKYFNCSIVRFAAAFSDWCEYGPLYIFLETWLTHNWKSRILGGKGKAAIPYIHVNCLINLLLTVIDKTDKLLSLDTYIASSYVSASHQELFNLATKFFYGDTKKSIHMPKPISALGVLGMYTVGRITGKMPFERPWMIRYIDKQMLVDNSYTREILNWQPTRRYMIQRRLLYMIEHMKSYPFEWQKRNHVLLKQDNVNPNFLIYEELDKQRDAIIELCLDYLLSEDNYETFRGYHSIERAVLKKDTVTLFNFLSVAVRGKDRMAIINYAREIAEIRFQQNFRPQEVLDAIKVISRIIREELIKQPQLKHMEQAIYDEISLTFQLAQDEIEGKFEALLRREHPLSTLNYNKPRGKSNDMSAVN
ncbi:MAG: NAD-dependent epimerase/dehydratase family protein [Caldithrix sp.]|nr:NAD-dependent epimerase/dehydratase family protein [Caldithrix sp.]